MMIPTGSAAKPLCADNGQSKPKKGPGKAGRNTYGTVSRTLAAIGDSSASAGSSRGQVKASPVSDYVPMAPWRAPGLTVPKSSSSSSSSGQGHPLQVPPLYDALPARRRPSDPLWYILLTDKEVRWRQSDTILSKHHAPVSKKALKGSLLRGVGTATAAGNSGLIRVAGLSDDREFECRRQEVAPLTDPEKELLRALSTDAKRIAIYQEGCLLANAADLRPGCRVRVKHKNYPKSPAEDAEAVVRYVGPLTGNISGIRFGLELMEEGHRGHGTSDGEFGKKQYFRTEPDCAVFVGIDKLVLPALSPLPPLSQPAAGAEPRRVSGERPKTLASYGEIRVGMCAWFPVGSDSWELGKVVLIVSPPGQTECFIAMETPKTGGNYQQSWNGYWDKTHLFSPREDMHTYFLPANSVIPEHLMSDKQPGATATEPISAVPAVKVRAANVRKQAEPFYAMASKPRKSAGQPGPESRWNTARPRHDISDSLYPEAGRHWEIGADDFLSASGQFSDSYKSGFVRKVKGKLRKFNNGSRDEDPSKSQWSQESATGGYSIGELDLLEEDVVAEITKVIYRDWRTMAHALYLSKEDVERVEQTAGTQRERTVRMLRLWQEKMASFDKFSRLAQACRMCSFDSLADSLEQGLDDETLMTVACGVSKQKVRPLGLSLNISEPELERVEAGCESTMPLVRMLLAKWRMRQSHSSDKILLLSQALEGCGLKQLALEVARGLDDDLMLSFAIQIGHDWKILAFALGQSTEDIVRLEDFSEDKQPYQMLMQWRQRLPRKFDLLGSLSNGLRDAGLPQLAEELVQGVEDGLIHHLATLTGGGGAWERLALRLGLAEDTLTALKAGAVSEVDTAVRALTKWRERHDYAEPRFPYLMAALRDCGLDDAAETLEEERRLKAEAEEKRQRAAPAMRARPAGMESKYVTRELLVKVSKQLDFKLLCAVMAFPSEVYVEIENHWPRPEQRVFALLDRWHRRGDLERRRISELLQVIASVGGKPSLVDEVMRTEASDKKEGDYFGTSATTAATAATAAAAAEEVSGSSLGPENREAVVEVCPDLEVNSMVEFSVRQGTAKHYGVIRWIGIPLGNSNKNLVAGIELESALANGATDGTFNKKRYFQCEPNRAMFVYLYNCRSDSRFPSQSQTFRVSKRQTSLDFGGFESPMVQGFVDPPGSLQAGFVGMHKGIQGDQNSCYLDTTLYSMFAFCSVFDPLLHRIQGKDDLRLYEEVQRILREGIVNPLRKNGFVRADRILQLREHLDNLGTTKGLMNEEKDPEEFLHTLLSEVFKSPPLLRIRHGDSQEVDLSNIYQIFLDKNEACELPTVEQLLLQSFQEHNLKLVDAPTCLIVQMPRFGKDYKMYSRIVPSMQIDITNIIENYPRQCVVCGSLADKECPTCTKEHILDAGTHSYCDECFHRMHIQDKRAHHQRQDLLLTDAFLKEFASKQVTDGLTPEEVDQHRQALLAPRLMDLSAVVCIRTSHYVAFVKAGRDADSEWVFFDSMADRQGDQQGYNIPQVTHLKDFKSWVTKEHIEQRVERKQLTGLMERLLGDAYICMYADMDKRNMTYV